MPDFCQNAGLGVKILQLAGCEADDFLHAFKGFTGKRHALNVTCAMFSQLAARSLSIFIADNAYRCNIYLV